ncbi:secreted RxLR effector protein 161-like [Tasmannia lanceolata]|uniref:secreted RxLR effector protein 161-like n=1 Tax=Tasmannia lanceolata TaxID=3420 RepID=UPI0040635430
MGVKPTGCPMDPNAKLLPDLGELMNDPGRSRRLVGKLIYLPVTRPDISFALGMVGRFMSSPRTSHWAAVIHIIKYLKGTPGKRLCFRKYGHEKVEGYNDADWAKSPADRRSTTRNYTFVGGNLVSWRSKSKTSLPNQVQRPSIGLCLIQVGS